MTDSQSHGTAGHHGGPAVNAYLIIFGALVIFTLISFVVNSFVRAGHLTAAVGFALILGVAVCKATLVGMWFMHLKWDWGRVFFMIIPVLILGTMMVIVLLPDIVLVWSPYVNPYDIYGSAGEIPKNIRLLP
jgi:cytochrome c oxidase subunit 4